MITTNLKNAMAYSGIGADAGGKVQSEIIQTVLNFSDEGLLSSVAPGPALKKEVSALFKKAQRELINECHDHVGLFPVTVGKNGVASISTRAKFFFSPKDQKRYGLDEFVTAAMEAGKYCSSSTDVDDAQHFVMGGKKYRWAIPLPPKGSGKKACVDPMFPGDVATAKSRVLKYIEKNGLEGLTVNMTAEELTASAKPVTETGEPVTSNKTPAEKLMAALSNALRYAKDVNEKPAITLAINIMKRIEEALRS